VVAIPANIAEEVAHDAAEQDLFETFVHEKGCARAIDLRPLPAGCRLEAGLRGLARQAQGNESIDDPSDAFGINRIFSQQRAARPQANLTYLVSRLGFAVGAAAANPRSAGDYDAATPV